MNRAAAIAGAAVVCALALASCVTTKPPKVAAARPGDFDRALVQRGAALSAIGNCRGCHTTAAGKSFAGGVPFPTPFGTVYSTNITPDVETGIGAWSEADFIRAMREGVDRGGHHLYPVFPYDHFTHVTDEDDRAIYAYVMTRPAVRARAPANELAFPFNLRATLGVWKALYLKRGEEKFASRGEYLVEGLGHCGGCHTPRNAAGAEIRERRLAGGDAEGWHAYAIDARSESPLRWTVDTLTAYLRNGFHAEHGVSRGPMALVTDELAQAPEADVRAMATYIVSLMGSSPKPAPPQPIPENGDGGAIYASVCDSCHEASQPLPFGGLALPLSMGVAGESPLNLFNVILYGLPPANGTTAPIMPGFDGALTDAQIVELATWMRARFTRKAPWHDVEETLRQARRHGAEGARFAAGGNGSDPARIPERR